MDFCTFNTEPPRLASRQLMTPGVLILDFRARSGVGDFPADPNAPRRRGCRSIELRARRLVGREKGIHCVFCMSVEIEQRDVLFSTCEPFQSGIVQNRACATGRAQSRTH